MPNIRPFDLPPATEVPSSAAFILDTGAVVQKASAEQIVDSAIPLATQAEAETGSGNDTRMSPLRVQQAINAQALSQDFLAGPDGAGAVGLEQGGTVQEAINWVTPEMFSGDATTALESSLAFLGLIGGGELRVPIGAYTITRELKVPSNVTMRGAGRDITIIKADDSLAANQNVITNSLNDRLARTTYNDNIHVWDMTVDANWQGRDPTEAQSTQTQGTGIKFSTVRNSSIRRVRAINGLLHCIDIMASTYFDDGNINNTAVGPSLDCVIEGCIAENSQRDDGITTHNSGRIVIDRCQSFRDRATYGEPRLSQHGIEIDEGSFDVTVRDCYTKGWTSGFQAKGHTTTMPAINVLFDHCFAEECAMGFQIEHLDPAAIPVGQVKYARNVTLRNCKAINIRATVAAPVPYIVYMRGYSGVLIDGFEVDDFGGGVFAIESGMTGLVIRNILFWGGSSRTGEGTGLIHGYGTAADGDIAVENVRSNVPQPVPLVRFSSSGTIKSIRGVSGTGTDAAVPCVWLSRNVNDVVSDIRQTGYSCDIRANTEVLNLSNHVQLESGMRCIMSGVGAPEGVVDAPLGALYTTTSGTATQYIKATAPTANTGWVVVGAQT